MCTYLVIVGIKFRRQVLSITKASHQLSISCNLWIRRIQINAEQEREYDRFVAYFISQRTRNQSVHLRK